jgi:hypothetical protein
VWIDSICIDQRNVIEKNAPVRLMGAIYQHAQRVIAWVKMEDWDEDDVGDTKLEVSVCAGE